MAVSRAVLVSDCVSVRDALGDSADGVSAAVAVRERRCLDRVSSLDNVPLTLSECEGDGKGVRDCDGDCELVGPERVAAVRVMEVELDSSNEVLRVRETLKEADELLREDDKLWKTDCDSDNESVASAYGGLHGIASGGLTPPFRVIACVIR